MTTQTGPTLAPVRFETLPFGSLDRELDEVEAPLTLTVTCSPTHGIDHTVDVAERVRQRGHRVIVHLAARMVRSEAHLDELLGRMSAAGIEDLFLVGGDQQRSSGPFAKGLDLLPVLRTHPDGPKLIGVPAYPEGHPLIAPDVLLEDLRAKAPLADYLVTQLCFHPSTIADWLAQIRGADIGLPAYVGLPGMVDRKRLLEISLRVGVGTSISYLRKQHGFARFAGNVHKLAERLYDEVSPLVGGELGVAGLHLFTFNRLVETARFVECRNTESQNGKIDRQRR